MEGLDSTRKVFRARKTIGACCKSPVVTLGKIKNFLDGEKATRKTLKKEACLSNSVSKNTAACISAAKEEHAKCPNGLVELEINLIEKNGKNLHRSESTVIVHEMGVESQQPYNAYLENCKVDVSFEKGVTAGNHEYSPDEQLCYAEKEFSEDTTCAEATRSEAKRKTPDVENEENTNAKRLRASQYIKDDSMSLLLENKKFLEQIQEIVKLQVLSLYKEMFSNKFEELTARITQMECIKKHETLASSFQNRVTKITKRVNIALEAQKKLLSSSSNAMRKNEREKDERTKRNLTPSFIDLTEDDEQRLCFQETDTHNQHAPVSEAASQSTHSSETEQQWAQAGSEQTACSALIPKTPPPPELSVASDVEVSSHKLEQPVSLPKTPPPPQLSPARHARQHILTLKNSVPQMSLPLTSSLTKLNASSESCFPASKPSQQASLLRTSPAAKLPPILDSTLLPQKPSHSASIPRPPLPPTASATESSLHLSKTAFPVSSLESVPASQLCSEEQTLVQKADHPGQFPKTPTTPKKIDGEGNANSHNLAHPAALPKTPPPPELPPEAANILPPQKPELKLTHVLNPKGIALSWNVATIDPNCAPVHSYHLYAYHEESGIKTSQWKKLGEIKALPLPMACALSQFVAGNKYYFAVRAKDIYGCYGPFCDVKSTTV